MSQGGSDRSVDAVVVGSGAGGLAAAVTAARLGLQVLVLEKDSLYGGTTARSGGVLWVPCHGLGDGSNGPDSPEAARRYLQGECGAAFDADKVDAFLRHGPRMVDFFTRQTEVAFVNLPEFPDYHPDRPGASQGGRSILAAPYDARRLGPRMKQLRPPLKEITFMGMMFNASEEVQHFFKVTRSLRSAAYVARRLAAHAVEMLRHGRATRLTNGNALAARLAQSAFGLGVELWLDTPVVELLREGDRVVGVVVQRGGERLRVNARRGVVLAAGGFPQDTERRRQLFPHAPTGTEHRSPAPAGNTGDGLRLARAVGAALDTHLPNAAAWIPVSAVPRGQGPAGVFPHLIDRYKPGIIAVTRRGERFVNEAHSYHDVGIAMQRAAAPGEPAEAFLICDHRALRRYGMGFVKPFPLPLLPHLRSGYLQRGRTLQALARQAGISPEGLVATVAEFNQGAERGEDPRFGRGASAYNRYLGDREHQPNPCVAPIADGPFYAIRLTIGDLGTFSGIRTDGAARALDEAGQPIPGLYAVGNDSTSIMGGNYPGAGITLGPALTFGFIAGEQLAAPSPPASQ